MLNREPQERGERLTVVLQARHRCRVGRLVTVTEGVDTGLDLIDSSLPRVGCDVVEQGPELCFDLSLCLGGDLGDEVPAAVQVMPNSALNPLCRGAGYADFGAGALGWWGVGVVEVGIIRQGWGEGCL